MLNMRKEKITEKVPHVSEGKKVSLEQVLSNQIGDDVALNVPCHVPNSPRLKKGNLKETQ
jgi:hypothetical protein